MNTTTHSGSTAHLVPESHPAHALLSVAHALLCPANALANPNIDKELTDLSILPIDEVTMPTDEVSDLRDVVDAINKLCDTMKTSTYEEDEAEFVECSASELTDIQDIDVTVIESQNELIEMISPEEVMIRKVETYSAERWSDTVSQMSFPGQVEDVTSDTEPVAVCSEMYYTASSEVSLISDVELADRIASEEEGQKSEKGGKECVMAGHVAAMRERFESMTRTNTPCPDLARSVSPSLDVFRNITPSPDRLG